ncbi:MAG: hypothetical protein QM820_12165 [Minicystis sp.]
MNRHDRRAAAKGSKNKPHQQSAQRASNARLPENSPGTSESLITTPQDWYYHATVHDGSSDRAIHNATRDYVVRHIALPYKLSRRFRVDGFDVIPARVRRFKITRTPVPFNPAQALKSVDLSSFTAAIVTLAAAGQQMNGAEDVTDDVLIQADQIITSEGLKAEPVSTLDTAVHHNKAFVVMSFAPEVRESFEAMKEACEKLGIKAVRVDQEISSGPIMDRIVGHLKEAKYVIADLTGARPNVYYENRILRRAVRGAWGGSICSYAVCDERYCIGRALRSSTSGSRAVCEHIRPDEDRGEVAATAEGYDRRPRE